MLKNLYILQYVININSSLVVMFQENLPLGSFDGLSQNTGTFSLGIYRKNWVR